MLILCIIANSSPIPGLQAFTTAAPCPPLPEPIGPVVHVDSTATLEAAVNALSSGTTILVAPGLYELSNTLVIDGVDQVAIRGAGGDPAQVVLRGRGMSNGNVGNVPHGILIGDADDVTIADLTIEQFYFHNIQIQGEKGPQRPLLYNLHLHDAGEQIIKVSTAGPPGPYSDNGVVACSELTYTDRARSWYTNGVDVLAGADWIVRDNLFARIRAPEGQLAGPAVLFWRNSHNTQVIRNRFIDCDRAIALGLSAPDGNARDGETVYDHQGGLIANNMITQSPGSSTADVGITVNYARDFAIYHNSVLLNDSFPWNIEYRFAVSSGEVGNNLTDGPILSRDGAGAALFGNITNANAGWFNHATVGDLHLRHTATAAIDSATVINELEDDFDGDPRPYGPAPDVGADELLGPPFSPTDWLYLPQVRRAPP